MAFSSSLAARSSSERSLAAFSASVAPRETYTDRVTKRRMEPVTTGQIYWGAVPFVLIQCIMVGLVIAFPKMVTHYKSAASGVDPSKVKIEIEQPDLPPPLDLSEPTKK